MCVTPNADPDLDLDLDLHLRTLTDQDAGLLVEATSGESAGALWDADPRSPYSANDARRALRAWDQHTATAASPV